MKEIICPKELNHLNVFPIIKEIEESSNECILKINFENTSFAYPMGLLILAEYLKFCSFRNKRDFDVEPPKKEPVKNFFDTIGFIEYVKRSDLAWRKTIEDKTFIPLSVIDFYDMKKLLKEAEASCMQEFIREYVGNYIDHIFGYRHNAVIYCFSEIVRNVHEHSGEIFCSIFGKKNKNNNTLEICVADSGCGIFNTLCKKKPLKNTKEALTAALLPGVSAESVSGEGVDANTGFGLYVLSELAKRHGFMIIGSIDTYLRIEASGTSSGKCCFPGTFVGFHVSLENFLNNDQEIKDIISEGERLLKQANHGK